MKATKTNQLRAFFLLVFFLGSGEGFWAAKKASRTGVPGVDKLPAARYLNTEPETKPQKKNKKKPSKNKKTNPPAELEQRTEKAEEEKKEEEGKTKLNLPLITNLTVKLEPQKPSSVRLDWDVSPANDTVIYVARYVRPLESRSLLFDADLASMRPLPPQTRSFLDYNIPDGTYYYAVVTAYEMSARNRLVLKPGVNYATKPMVIYRKQKSPKIAKSSGLYQAKGLYAVNAKDSVALSWSPAKASNVSYNIYKSYQPLVEAADLEFAQKLGVVDGDTLKYRDTNAIENRKTWYAITVTDNASAEEHKRLVANENIVQNTFTKVNIDDDRLALLPSALTPFLESGNAIKLLWSDPERPVPELVVFRSNRPITSVSALRHATHVGTVSYGVQQFLDRPLAPGVYFYALLPKKDERKLIGIFIAGRSFTSFGLRVYEKKHSDQKGKEKLEKIQEVQKEQTTGKNKKGALVEIRYLRARAVGKNNILVKWKIKKDKISAEDLDELQLLLYRSTEKLKTLDDLEEKGEFIEELDADTEEYLDEGLRPQKYYYALVVDYKGELQERLKAGKNYLRRPVRLGKRQESVKQEEKKEIIVKKIKKDRPPLSPYSLDRLNRILARTYHRRRFGAAIRQIAPFVYGRNVKSSVQSRALFYTGLSYYGLKRHRAALEFFVDERVRRFYPERSRFWYNRSIEKIGEKTGAKTGRRTR